MAAIVRAARAMLGRHLAPTRVQLTRPIPANRARFDDFFRSPVHYASSENLLAFTRADVERPVPGGHDRLASVGDQTVAAYLARLEQKSVADRLREVLVDAIAAGEPDVEAVAAELTMSGRTLQRRLRDEGTSFRDVLAGTRRELAEALLTSGAGSVTQIGHRLGFCETAAFSRAFRRWTGQSPASWRRSHSDEHLKNKPVRATIGRSSKAYAADDGSGPVASRSCGS
jgi:AraC-like DNA-binding protein